MSARRMAPLAAAALAVALTACGGDGGESANHPLGHEAVVKHTTIGADGKPAAATTLAITVLDVRKGTQQELQQGGFTLDPDEKRATPYYVDARFENQGGAAVKRDLGVALEDQDGNRISSTIVIDLGGKPFAKCRNAKDGELAPGESYESCILFLVPEGKKPKRVSFLPYDPEKPTEFVYWDVE